MASISDQKTLKSSELIDRVATSGYLGMEDRKACMTELLIRLKVGSISIDDILTLVQQRKSGNTN